MIKSETICSGILSIEATNDFLDATKHKFKESNKAKIMNLLNSFSNSWYFIILGELENIFWKLFNLVREVNIPILDDLWSIKFLTPC